MSEKILTISELNQQARQLLEQQLGQLWLAGEISNFSRPASGHWYFSLKDAKAQVRCAMFRHTNQYNAFTPDNGQHVIVKANITLYEPRGEYQLIIEKLMLDGVGALQQKFEQLKAKLQLEGLFDPQHKKKLPQVCKRVGIITSPSGAALQDILQILKRRDPQIEIIIYPSVVQGVDAPHSLIRALNIANQRQECDLLIIGRGGGSLEDLWCFNDEALARAIFASVIPIVSAVGHETDTTLSDLVADLRAPTPSAAAEMISRDRSQLLRNLQLYQQRIEVAIDYWLQHQHKQLNGLQQRVNRHHPHISLAQVTQRLAQLNYHLQQHMQAQLVRQQQLLHALHNQHQSYHPQLRLVQQRYQINQIEQQIQQLIQHRLKRQHSALHHQQSKLYQQTPQPQLTQARHLLMNYHTELIQSIKQRLTERQQEISLNATQLHAVSPLATLSRGYSITLNQAGQAVRSIEQASLAEKLTLQLNDGKLTVQVTQKTATKRN